MCAKLLNSNFLSVFATVHLARVTLLVCSGVVIQVVSGAYAPPVSKIHNICGM